MIPKPSPSRTLTTPISRSAASAYAFMADATNLPLWAGGLAKSVRPGGDGDWIVETPGGEARVRFAEKNGFGVLDHVVTLADGTEVGVPMRVVPNGGGCEVMLTVFRQPSMTDAGFEGDLALVRADLAALKRVLESRPE